MQLEFKVMGQILMRTDVQKLVANSRGYLTAHFQLPAEYTGTVTAYFGKRINNVMHTVPMTVDSTGMCAVPDEILESGTRESLTMYVWLSSADTDIYIPTSQVAITVYGSGAGTEADPLPSSTENQYAEIGRMYTEIVEVAQGPDTSFILEHGTISIFEGTKGNDADNGTWSARSSDIFHYNDGDTLVLSDVSEWLYYICYFDANGNYMGESNGDWTYVSSGATIHLPLGTNYCRFMVCQSGYKMDYTLEQLAQYVYILPSEQRGLWYEILKIQRQLAEIKAV